MEDLAMPQGLLSEEEYLEFEANSDIRHEYVGGMLFALDGGSDRLNRIAGNIYVALHGAARDTTCRVYMSDMRLKIGKDYYYPDIMLSCEPPHEENPTFRTDACAVVEVLSPSTEATDRRQKLLAYREVTTLQAYLVVHQHTQRVERFYRDADGNWQRADHVGGDIPIPCLSIRIPLSEIYEGL